jgi:hypothetical protein
VRAWSIGFGTAGLVGGAPVGFVSVGFFLGSSRLLAGFVSGMVDSPFQSHARAQGAGRARRGKSIAREQCDWMKYVTTALA